MKENFDPKPEIIGKTGEIVHSWYRSISFFETFSGGCKYCASFKEIEERYIYDWTEYWPRC